MGRSPWDTSEPPTYEQIVRWESMHLAHIKRVQREQQAYLEEAGGDPEDKTYRELQEVVDEFQEYIEDLYKLIRKYYRDVPRPVIAATEIDRSIKISLTAEEWERIEAAIGSGSVGSIGEYFQNLYRKS